MRSSKTASGKWRNPASLDSPRSVLTSPRWLLWYKEWIWPFYSASSVQRRPSCSGLRFCRCSIHIYTGRNIYLHFFTIFSQFSSFMPTIDFDTEWVLPFWYFRLILMVKCTSKHSFGGADVLVYSWRICCPGWLV